MLHIRQVRGFYWGIKEMSFKNFSGFILTREAL